MPRRKPNTPQQTHDRARARVAKRIEKLLATMPTNQPIASDAILKERLKEAEAARLALPKQQQDKIPPYKMPEQERT